VEQTVNLAFTLPVSQAEKVIALVKSFSSVESESRIAGSPQESDDETAKSEAAVKVTPIFRYQDHQKLKYLLEGRPDLQKMVRFIVQNEGKFFNDELGAELGHQDSRYTFSRLGHITRKLRKAGIQAEGFRGMNWYSTVPSSGRTLILVREDVLPVLTETLDN
jgi:hypothetical protein